jgi:predicted CXXCH cytochrome family protein
MDDMNPDAYVTGVEDADWEFTRSATDHNYYKGATLAYDSDGTGLSTKQTVTSFCAGCHAKFHGMNNDTETYTGTWPNFSGSSPWIRHPTDIILPNTGEYSGYDPINNYSVEAPVAWTDPTNPTRATAVVMCLSCHRPHGSNQPDMLRWDYSTMVAGGGGSGGCFTCHTTKK